MSDAPTVYEAAARAYAEQIYRGADCQQPDLFGGEL